MFSSSSSTNPRAALQCPRGSRALPSEAIQRWHRSVYVSALLGTGPLSLSIDWRWDLEEKLLLLCLLYGSFFTLNAENLFRGHRIPASLHEPKLIFAALGIDKAFSGAKYAGYVLPLSSLYFPPASLLGLVQAVSAGWRVGRGGVLEMSTAHVHGESASPAAVVSVRPYLWVVQPIGLVIRDSIARSSHKTPAFMARLLSFCLQL